MRFPIFVVWLKESLTKNGGLFFFHRLFESSLEVFHFFLRGVLGFSSDSPAFAGIFVNLTWVLPGLCSQNVFFSHMWNFLQQNPLGKTQKTWGSVALWHVHVWKRRETTIIYDTTWLDYILNCRLWGVPTMRILYRFLFRWGWIPLVQPGGFCLNHSFFCGWEKT